jgi:hypothetical protein
MTTRDYVTMSEEGRKEGRKEKSSNQSIEVMIT